MPDVKIESFLLISGPNRDEIHRELERILEHGQYPQAECREGEVPGVIRGEFSVWSGTIERRP